MRTRFLLAGLIVATVLVLLVTRPSGLPSPSIPGALAVHPPQKIVDFTLQNTAHLPTQRSDLEGKMVLLAFGYTHCPDICPITLGTLKQVKQTLGDTAADVHFVFISVDGPRDTPEVLARYLPLYDANIIGLTGPQDTVLEVMAGFGGTFRMKDYGGLVDSYTIDHTASFFLLNAKGEWVRTYTYGTRPADIAADLRLVMSQP